MPKKLTLLPSGTYAPIIVDDMSDVYGIMYAMTGDGYTNEEMYDYARQLRDELLLEGDKRVNIVGKRTQQINIRGKLGGCAHSRRCC